jgi:hypothetical protein
MREVYASLNSAAVSVRQTLLEEAGIQTFVRNDNLSRSVNAFIGFFQPALCVVDDAKYSEAMQLIHNMDHQELGSDWLCPNCKEMVPSSFESCWNCEMPKPVL